MRSVLANADRIYLYDNGSDGVADYPNGAVVLGDGTNRGLSFALNRIMERAETDGFTHVVTLDQDSVIPDGMFDAFRINLLKMDDRTGIVCPQIIDVRRKYMELKTEPEEEEIAFCITSGSCTSVQAWERVGRFDEYLFIDMIDNDFCKRLILSGYRIVRLNGLVLNQQLGNIVPKSDRSVKFWVGVGKLLKNPNFAKLSYRKTPVPDRVYYTCRNIVYLRKKMSGYGPVGYENFHCRTYPGFLIAFVLPNILRAKRNKGAILRAAVQGARDGRKAETGVWKIPEGKTE